MSSWECVCGGPFCIGGTQCYWVEFWDGLIVPGHWVSIGVSRRPLRETPFRLGTDRGKSHYPSTVRRANNGEKNQITNVGTEVVLRTFP